MEEQTTFEDEEDFQEWWNFNIEYAEKLAKQMRTDGITVPQALSILTHTMTAVIVTLGMNDRLFKDCIKNLLVEHGWWEKYGVD